MTMIKVYNKSNTVVMFGDRSSYTATIGPHQTMDLLEHQFNQCSSDINALMTRGLIQVLKEGEKPKVVPQQPPKRVPTAISHIKKSEAGVDMASVSGVKGGLDELADIEGGEDAIIDETISSEEESIEDAGQMVVPTSRNKSRAVNLVRARTQAPVQETASFEDEEDGAMVIPSHVPGGAKVRSIGELTDEERAALARDTDRLLEDLANENKLLRVVNNYYGWDANQKVQFISNTQDVAILKQLVKMEKSAKLVDLLRKKIKKLNQEDA